MAIQKDRVIKWAICFILAIGILLIPESDIVTWQMKMFLALTVFDILLIVFDLVDLLIAGLFLPTLLVVFNVTDTATAFSGWTNTTIYLLVGAYALSYALMDCGLLKRLSLIIVNAFGGSFNKMLYGVFFAGMVMGYLTFGNHQALLLTFAYGICVALNFEHTKESMVLMMVAGIGCLTVRSMMYYPTLHSIMTQQAQQVDPNFVINWYNPIIWAWPILFFCLGFIWLLTKMYKTKNYEFLGGKEYLQSELANMGKMSTAEKRAAIILAAFIVILLTQPLHKWPVEYAFMTIPWIMYLPAVHVANKETIKRLPYGMFFFMVACFGIGATAVSLGLGDLITEKLTPMLSGVGPIQFMFVILAIGTICNLVLTPLAMISSLSYPIAVLCSNLGFGMIPAFMTMYFTVECIFLPHETAAVLMLYSFGQIPMKDFIKLFALRFILFLVFFTIIIIPYWYLIGVM